MPTYLSPGVYVEETDSGSRPIEGVGTAVAAFVGLAEKGPHSGLVVGRADQGLTHQDGVEARPGQACL